jgi:crotonobetainyl-CoA:carnitine CoA-transferase CaiB-like acyl-CoA transferase
MTEALAGIRLLDFTWLMAGAFGPKYLAAFGAEVIRIEWKDKIDFLRYGAPFLSPPGEKADPMTRPNSLNRASFFNDINSGKRGITLNMHKRRGKELFAELLRVSDGVMDNFTPTTLARWGFSFEKMREIRPDIVYVQSPGFGARGPYSPFRSYGSIGQGASGLTYEIGLPDRGPCGWGYSYMDVTAGWYVALNTMAALRHRNKTGQAHHLDTAQTDAAIYMTGTAILDYSANGRHYVRTGNRSPHVYAAPHGAYRCADDPEWTGIASSDRWIAITCFTEAHWQALVEEMGNPAWASEPQFATLEARYQNQDALDAKLTEWTRTQERYSLMERLQARGVPAGVCQDARDRVELDPQLKHLGFFKTVPHSEVGSYRLQGIPGRFSKTPPDVGGRHGRGAPCFGEDNEYVFGEILGYSTAQIAQLREEGPRHGYRPFCGLFGYSHHRSGQRERRVRRQADGDEWGGGDPHRAAGRRARPQDRPVLPGRAGRAGGRPRAQSLSLALQHG